MCSSFARVPSCVRHDALLIPWCAWLVAERPGCTASWGTRYSQAWTGTSRDHAIGVRYEECVGQTAERYCSSENSLLRRQTRPCSTAKRVAPVREVTPSLP